MEKKPKKVVIGSMKGGVGKTLLTMMVGGHLAETEKVLLIDVDNQCNLSTNFGIDVSDPEGTYSSLDIFRDEESRLEDLVIKAPLPEVPNLDIIPGNSCLQQVEAELYARPAGEYVLANWLDNNEAAISEYDYVLFDIHPEIGVLNQNVYYSADSIILVACNDVNSIMGVHQFQATWRILCKNLRTSYNVRAVIVNMADERTTLTKDALNYIANHVELKDLLVLPAVHNSVFLKRAAQEGKTACHYNPGKISRKTQGRALAELAELCKNLKGRGAL